MAVNQYRSKVVFGDEVLMDLTADTVTPDKMLAGITAHDASGAPIEGTCTYDVDSQDATARVAEILDGQTAYVRGAKVTGTMPNNGSVKLNIESVNGVANIPQGYHDGSGSVSLADADKSKLVPDNIREGVSILGVTGSMSTTEGENAEETRTVTPSKEQQIITPGSGYTCLRQVIVNGIPYVESQNSAGGITVTIG